MLQYVTRMFRDSDVNLLRVNCLLSFWRPNNYHRNGLISIESQCIQGDITNDGVIDILDIVTLVNAILGPVELTDLESCAADMNGDSIVDILDIVMLVNYILN